jgi:hypothetical protein
MDFPPSFYDRLEDWLNLAVYDINADYRMGRSADLSALLGFPVNVTFDEHYQHIAYTDQTIIVGARATDDEIKAKFAEITKAKPMKLQGLASKMALLRHSLELEAEKLGNRVDGAASKSTEAFAKSHAFLDNTDKDLAEVESFIAELNTATNDPPK